MKAFLGDDFLLSNKVSEALYHDHAKDMPIIDFHNHLEPRHIAENYEYKNITEAWLEGDHYKWRAMRGSGVDEKFITGDASDEEKFAKWAETVPQTLRNPLFHWTHLELKRYFGITELLSSSNSKEIYAETNRQLQNESHTCVGLLKQMNAEILCTTDDPADDLKYHKQIKLQNPGFKVFPSFRPEIALNIDDTENYLPYISKLEQASEIKIKGLDDLLSALKNRIEYFHEMGGREADISFVQLPKLNPKAVNRDGNFKLILNGQKLDQDISEDLKAFILTELCKMYHKKGWIQQFHIGVIRNNSARAFKEIGPNAGFDSMADLDQASSLSSFFSELDKTDQLAKTILYNLNPKDNYAFATMMGNFNGGKIRGKMQFGTGWWYLDQKEGMIDQMNTFSNVGLLSNFIGMLTDSRSFLSFPRHEYFRRILCDLIGQDVMNGELPNDMDLMGKLVKDICYYNAKEYFKYNLD